MADDQRLLDESPLTSVDDYVAVGGGTGIVAAREAPDEILGIVEASGLRGRGGAGFPTGRKWRSVRDAARESDNPLYVVANAAEGEPGTYKDRTLIRRNPYRFLEGLLIARHVTGATGAYVGIKDKFPERKRLVDARDEMVDAGWMHAGDIEIVGGPDDYLFGEESALLEVIEGHDALPRILKPFEVGLFASEDASRANPTIVNNVETLAHVAQIVANGADWFRERGTDDSPGTMCFTVVGDVEAPGVYELPLGTPLRTVLDIAGASDVKAVYSGVSNPVMTKEHLDVPTGFDTMKDAGGGLGSAGFIVYDSARSMVRAAAVLMRFLADESCGQCNACKLGTAALAEQLERLAAGNGSPGAADALVRRAADITDQNRCYLPVGGQALLTSTVTTFGDEFVAAGEAGATDGERAYPTPLIESIDDDTGEVVFSGRSAH